MNQVVICDTNAVIQLAIICPECLKEQEGKLQFVVHSLVRQEIFILRKDDEKEKRLGKIFDFIQNEVPKNNKFNLPIRQKEQRLDQMIRNVEYGLSPELISAGSSPNDRKFLMLVKTNNTTLLTNDRTLFNLGKALLKDQETWKVSDAIERIEKAGMMLKDKIQEGIDELQSYSEFLSSECSEKIKSLGYKYR